MTTPPPSLQADLSYLRQMAEHGRRGPILGGIFLLSSGVLFGTVCILQWFLLTHVPALTRIATNDLWPTAILIYGGLWIWLYRKRTRGIAAAHTGSNVNFGAAWIACAIGIGVESIAIASFCHFQNAPTALLLIIPSVFAFYGSAWMVTGAMTRQRWMYGAATTAFAVALVLGIMPAGLDQLLVMGLALFLTLAVPGGQLMRQEPRQ